METNAVSRIDRTRKVHSQDIFVYSKSMDRDIDTYYKDCVEDYETLAQRIRDGVIEQLNLKSMAYEDKNHIPLVANFTRVNGWCGVCDNLRTFCLDSQNYADDFSKSPYLFYTIGFITRRTQNNSDTETSSDHYAKLKTWHMNRRYLL